MERSTNCIFCGEMTTRDYVFSDPHEVIRSIQERGRGLDTVAIAGYEPLSHPGVLDMIAACREVGIPQVELMTTGIPLGDRQLCDALVRAGLTSAVVPLYSDVEDENDFVMRRRGAWRATLRGLDRLHELGCCIHLHTLIARQNLHAIDRLYRFATARWGASFVAAPPRNKTKSTNYEDIAVRYADLAEAVREAPVVGMALCCNPRMQAHPDLDRAWPLQLTLGSMSDLMRFYFMQGLEQPGRVLRLHPETRVHRHRAATAPVRAGAATAPDPLIRPGSSGCLLPSSAARSR